MKQVFFNLEDTLQVLADFPDQKEISDKLPGFDANFNLQKLLHDCVYRKVKCPKYHLVAVWKNVWRSALASVVSAGWLRR